MELERRGRGDGNSGHGETGAAPLAAETTLTLLTLLEGRGKLFLLRRQDGGRSSRMISSSVMSSSMRTCSPTKGIWTSRNSLQRETWCVSAMYRSETSERCLAYLVVPIKLYVCTNTVS